MHLHTHPYLTHPDTSHPYTLSTPTHSQMPPQHIPTHSYIPGPLYGIFQLCLKKNRAPGIFPPDLSNAQDARVGWDFKALSLSISLTCG